MSRLINIGIGHQIRTRREELNLNVPDLAGRAGIDAERIERHEAGEERVTAVELLHYKRALGVEVRHFYQGFPATKDKAEALLKKLKEDAA